MARLILSASAQVKCLATIFPSPMLVTMISAPKNRLNTSTLETLSLGIVIWSDPIRNLFLFSQVIFLSDIMILSGLKIFPPRRIVE